MMKYTGADSPKKPQPEQFIARCGFFIVDGYSISPPLVDPSLNIINKLSERKINVYIGVRPTFGLQ